jgi:hypothetical protein
MNAIEAGGIRVTHSQGEFDIGRYNFQESLKRLEEILTPDTLVFIHDIHKRKTIFFSDGTITYDSKFTIQKGKRNYSYVRVGDERAFDYRIASSDERLMSSPITTWLNEMSWWRNGRTLVPIDEALFSDVYKNETAAIVIGDSLKNTFPEAIQALEFARDAMHFELSTIYVSGKRNSLYGENDNLKDIRERQTQRTVNVSAIKNLLELELRKTDQSFDPKYDYFNVIELGNCSESIMDIWRKKYPGIGEKMNKNDLVVYDNLKGVAAAFLKLDYGGAYILPVNGNDQLIDSAFSEEMVKKIYPAT